MRPRGVLAVVIAGAALCGTALAAVCHPDPAGTRVLVVHGPVTGYTLRAGHVELGLMDGLGCARRVSWNIAVAPPLRVVGRTTGRGCAGRLALGDTVRVPALEPTRVLAFNGSRRAVVGATVVTLFNRGRPIARIQRLSRRPALKAVLRGSRLVILVRGSEIPDRPDRLEVYDTPSRRSLGSWPLVERPVTLDLAGGVALFSGAGRSGVYALRLHDGSTTLLAPAWSGDTPQIEPAGVVYEDGTYDRDRAVWRVPVKFVPSGAISRDFRRTFRTLRTDGPITGLSMDGPNLAVAFQGRSGECDQIRIWQVLWHDVAKPTMDSGAGCPRRRTHIEAVAAAGISAHWILDTATGQRLVWSSSKNCVQHLTAQTRRGSGDHLLGVAGDTRIVAYATGHDATGTTTLSLAGASVGRRETHLLLRQPPRAISANRDRVALLQPDGKVAIVSATGDPETSIDVGNVQAIALRGNSLVTVANRRVDVYDVDTRRVHRWTVPGRATAVSTRYGLAVIAVGRKVIGLRLSDGRRAELAHTRTKALAVIDSAGVAVASNSGTKGTVTFIPMGEVERALGIR
jgi:hypothetical protein